MRSGELPTDIDKGLWSNDHPRGPKAVAAKVLSQHWLARQIPQHRSWRGADFLA